MKQINPNDIRKGWGIGLRDGTIGTMEDNKRGLRRMARMFSSVFGSYSLGEIYSHDIVSAQDPDGNTYVVVLTDAQRKRMDRVNAQFRKWRTV